MITRHGSGPVSFSETQQPPRRQVIVWPDCRLVELIDRAAGRQVTTRSEYQRRAIINQLRTDGFDPAAP